MFSRKRKKQKEKKAEKKPKKYSRFLAISMGKEKDYFVENLSMLLVFGMDILDALDSIKKELKSSGSKKILKGIKNEIKAGASISKALENSRIFSQHTVSLIRIGEESGRLKENLKAIAVQQQKDRIFKGKIRSAMMYPVLVLILSVVIGIGVAWFILPRLATVFSQLDMELPIITQWLIWVGEFLSLHGKVFIPSFIFFVFILTYFVFYFPKTKFLGQWVLFQLPGVKRLIKETEVARFGFLLGTLLEAGMPVVSALDALGRSTSCKR